ncbi:MAG: CDP-alcohol phosphatidyltransferase family protein [Planctomycetaceae bacterium]
MSTSEEPQKKKTHREKAFALLPTLLTLGNAVCGFGAITILARVGPSFEVVPEDPTAAFDAAAEMVKAAQLIFLAMLFDALDGSAARLTNQTSEFGAMLDSLCDVVSFGVAPAFMMLKLTDPKHHLMGTSFQAPFHYSIDFLWAIAALYMACAILRLARFNVETDEEDSHEGFSGLPSPAAAGVIAGFPIGVMTLKKLIGPAVELGPDGEVMTNVTTTAAWAQPVGEVVLPALAVLLPFITLATAVLMVSRIRYPHVFNQILRGNRGRMQLLQLVFTLALVFQVRGMAVPVIFCWFAFAGPLQAVWRKYIMARFSKTSAAL